MSCNLNCTKPADLLLHCHPSQVLILKEAILGRLDALRGERTSGVGGQWTTGDVHWGGGDATQTLKKKTQKNLQQKKQERTERNRMKITSGARWMYTLVWFSIAHHDNLCKMMDFFPCHKQTNKKGGETASISSKKKFHLAIFCFKFGAILIQKRFHMWPKNRKWKKKQQPDNNIWFQGENWVKIRNLSKSEKNFPCKDQKNAGEKYKNTIIQKKHTKPQKKAKHHVVSLPCQSPSVSTQTWEEKGHLSIGTTFWNPSTARVGGVAELLYL